MEDTNVVFVLVYIYLPYYVYNQAYAGKKYFVSQCVNCVVCVCECEMHVYMCAFILIDR